MNQRQRRSAGVQAGNPPFLLERTEPDLRFSSEATQGEQIVLVCFGSLTPHRPLRKLCRDSYACLVEGKASTASRLSGAGNAGPGQATRSSLISLKNHA
jgi:hypothetical protein